MKSRSNHLVSFRASLGFAAVERVEYIWFADSAISTWNSVSQVQGNKGEFHIQLPASELGSIMLRVRTCDGRQPLHLFGALPASPCQSILDGAQFETPVVFIGYHEEYRNTQSEHLVLACASCCGFAAMPPCV